MTIYTAAVAGALMISGAMAGGPLGGGPLGKHGPGHGGGEFIAVAQPLAIAQPIAVAQPAPLYSTGLDASSSSLTGGFVGGAVGGHGVGGYGAYATPVTYGSYGGGVVGGIGAVGGYGVGGIGAVGGYGVGGGVFSAPALGFDTFSYQQAAPIAQAFEVEQYVANDPQFFQKDVQTTTHVGKQRVTHHPVYHRTNVVNNVVHDTVDSHVYHHLGDMQHSQRHVAGRNTQAGKIDVDHGKIGHDKYGAVVGQYIAGGGVTGAVGAVGPAPYAVGGHGGIGPW